MSAFVLPGAILFVFLRVLFALSVVHDRLEVNRTPAVRLNPKASESFPLHNSVGLVDRDNGFRPEWHLT